MSVLKRTRKTRLLFFLGADIILLAASVGVSFFLRFEGNIPDVYKGEVIVSTIILAAIFVIPLLYFFNSYKFSWSYVSTEELVELWKAISIGFIFLAGIVLFFRESELFQAFPRSILIMSYVFSLFLLGGLRIAKRIYLQMYPVKEDENKRKTLIVGAGDAGEQVVRSMISGRDKAFPVAFVDDSALKQGILIHGIRVVGTIEEIPSVIEMYGVEEIIVALPSAGSKAIQRTVNKAREAGIRHIKVVPSFDEIVRKGVPIDAVREVRVEDLLGREPVALHVELIEEFLKEKTVLITGGAGSIGSELCRQVARFRPERLIIFDQDETGVFHISNELQRTFPSLQISSIIGDVRDTRRVEYMFRTYKPHVVFHAAAYKHVPLMEENISEAVKNNIFGTLVVGEAAVQNSAERFVFISTDKAINPSSTMGATKRVGEMIMQVLNERGDTKFVSVRFGNVLDSRGSVIPTFRERLKRREALEVTHPDMKRYFMITSEACLLVMEAGALGEGGEVFALDMGNPVKIVDLAHSMIRLSGLEPDKDIPVVFIGPRPGEKLFEEILTAEEGVVATKNEQIFRAKLSPIDTESLLKGLSRLQEIVDSSEKEGCRAVLQEIVPNYIPQMWNNS